MLDLLVKGGTLVDGTGSARRRADVGVRDGCVVAVGEVEEAAARTIDAEGLVVAPGFVDIHTHYDAQVLWDPVLTPSSIHGATTVISGNCGFTLAPMAPEHTDYVTRMLSLVEGMPLESLVAAVPYDWKTFGEYLDRLDGHLGINVGFLVGHSTLRRVVMGADAVGHEATTEQIRAMCDLLSESIAGGGLGLSSSMGPLHHDGDGNPVPSRAATADELVALAATTGAHEGTTLEFIPGVGPATPTPEGLELLARMSSAANRPVNWNVITVNVNQRDNVWRTLDRIAAGAEQRGARIVTLTSCDVTRTYLSFRTGFLFTMIPGWVKTMTLPPDEKLRALRDPDVRTRLRETGWSWRDWGSMTIVSTRAPENKRHEGRLVGELAAEQGRHPLEVIFDLVVTDDLDTVLLPPPIAGAGDEEEAWKLRAELWPDARIIVGGSDAGAHLDMLSTFTFGTSVLRAAREHELMDLETAVHLISDRPARLYGIRGRGRIADGCHADLVVFDADRIAPRPPEFRNDLPAGAGRLYAEADGMHHVVVNGREIVRDNALTGDLPGAVLRSGRDTATVTAR